jgi:hypothetical protein
MGFSRRNSAARRLTAEQVVEIRRQYDEGATQASLGIAFGISTVQIGRIVRGESWVDNQAPRQGSVQANIAQQPGESFADRITRLYAEKHKEVKTPPPSLLDGGDAPDETGGAGLERLVVEPIPDAKT